VPNAYKRNAELFAGSKIPETISDVNGFFERTTSFRHGRRDYVNSA